MKILSVETSTDACSAALLIDGEIEERFQIAPREHTRLILTMIDSLLSEAQINVGDLDGLAFGCGPGSFTGVRIATGVVHGIAVGSDLPLLPISTLAAMAHQCFERTVHDCALVAMDARMDEVYWGVYRRSILSLVELEGTESVGPAMQVGLPLKKGYGVGSGWKTQIKDLEQRVNKKLLGYDADYWPSALSVAAIAAKRFANGETASIEQALPVYLRDKVVHGR